MQACRLWGPAEAVGGGVATDSRQTGPRAFISGPQAGASLQCAPHRPQSTELRRSGSRMGPCPSCPFCPHKGPCPFLGSALASGRHLPRSALGSGISGAAVVGQAYGLALGWPQPAPGGPHTPSWHFVLPHEAQPHCPLPSGNSCSQLGHAHPCTSPCAASGESSLLRCCLWECCLDRPPLPSGSALP